MKKFLISITIVFSGSLFAQHGDAGMTTDYPVNSEKAMNEDEFKPVIIPSLMFGTNMPFGAYASIDPNRDYGITKGFADPGTAVDIGIMFQLKDRFGLTVGFSYFNNPMSVKRFSEYMEHYFRLNNINDYQYRLQTGSWRNNSFLLGVAYRSPEKRASFELHLKFGLLTSRSPEISIDSVNTSGEIDNYFSSESELNFSLALSPGMKFKLRLIDRLYLDLGASVLLSPVDIDEGLYPENVGFFNNVANESAVVLSFNLMGGISYEFDW